MVNDRNNKYSVLVLLFAFCDLPFTLEPSRAVPFQVRFFIYYRALSSIIVQLFLKITLPLNSLVEPTFRLSF